MKQITLILGIIMIVSSLKAQETNQSISKVEKFLKSNNKIIVSSPLYTSNVINYSDNLYISLFKCYELSGKDTTIGVSINAKKNLLTVVGSTLYYLDKTLKGYLDYEDIPEIISWIDLIKEKIISQKNSNLNYASFTPKRGNAIMYFMKDQFVGAKKIQEKDKWSLIIQTNKDDSYSQIKVDDFNVFYAEFKKIQKIIDGSKN